MGYLRMIKRPYSAVVDLILRKVPGAYIYHQASTSTSIYIKFAGLAMQGMISSPNCPAHANDHEIARQAYTLADAMLAKR